MIKIVVDSTCDIPENKIKEFDIKIVPLHVLLGEKEYIDKINIAPEDIYEFVEKNKVLPKTSAPSIKNTIEILNSIIDNGDEAIVFTISSSMSTSYNVVNMAKEETKEPNKIYVVDSMNLSSGVALLVLKACELVKDGKSVTEIIEVIEKLRYKVNASFVVDTLEYLHKGGRCSSISFIAGSVIKIHPLINVCDGEMKLGAKYRGKMLKVFKNYLRDKQEEIKNSDKSRIFVTHTKCDEEIINYILDSIKEIADFKEIIDCDAGSVITSHCGKGTLGILFINED